MVKGGRPVERLRKKLRSESGASILLALLMFLVCALVGATVLAAAASNAGKARSSRTEQQKFLNLSSAIQLVADEIQRAEYTGKYQVYKWKTPEVTDPVSGSVITPAIDWFFCQQTAGDYSCGDLTDQLPFGQKLDEIFGEQFTGTGYAPLYASPSAAGEYDLLVKLEGTFPSDSAPKGYEVPKEVTVRVKLDGNTHHILLTAWEGKGSIPTDPTTGSVDLSKTMQAELVAKKGTAPVLDYNPGTRTAGTPPADEAATPKDAAGAPMKWELHWIRKGAVSS